LVIFIQGIIIKVKIIAVIIVLNTLNKESIGLSIPIKKVPDNERICNKIKIIETVLYFRLRIKRRIKYNRNATINKCDFGHRTPT